MILFDKICGECSIKVFNPNNIVVACRHVFFRLINRDSHEIIKNDITKFWIQNTIPSPNYLYPRIIDKDKSIIVNQYNQYNVNIFKKEKMVIIIAIMSKFHPGKESMIVQIVAQHCHDHVVILISSSRSEKGKQISWLQGIYITPIPTNKPPLPT